MKCSQCGFETEEGKRFCPECGAMLPLSDVVSEDAPEEVTEEAVLDSAEEAVFEGEEAPAEADITDEPIGGEEADVEPADSAEEAAFDSEKEPAPTDITPEPIDEMEVTAEPEDADTLDVTEEPEDASVAEEPAAVQEAPAVVAAPACADSAATPTATVEKEHPLVPPATGKYATEKPIGILRWTGLDILFHLPFVRFVMTIVWSFTNVRPSLKNYARARLLWNIIVLIIAIAAVILLRFVLDAYSDEISAVLGGLMKGLNGFFSAYGA